MMKPVLAILVLILLATAAFADAMPDFILPDMNNNVSPQKYLGRISSIIQDHSARIPSSGIYANH
jgi:hypothetical protein